jgi:glycolate oxidase
MALIDELAGRLREVVGARNVLVDPADTAAFAGDELALETHQRIPPVVVRPADEQEIVQVMRLCHAERIPVTVRGGGTGLAAGCAPSPGALVLAMDRLDQIVEVDPLNHTLTARAGATLRSIYDAVEQTDLFFPPHPGAENAQIGGVIATNAGGARAVKYGTARRFLLGLRVVLADGTPLRLGGKVVKASVGYHLAELLVGSEGTLGVITEVTLALLPRPAASLTLVASFADLRAAIGAVPDLMRGGIVPTAVEFVEHSVMRCAERRLQRAWPVRGGAASLMVILDAASEAEVIQHAETIGERLQALHAAEIVVADSGAKQREILELRSILYEALRPGTVEIFDICLPRSEVPAHVERVHELEAETGMPLPTYGHAADGNVHTHTMRRQLTDGLLGDELPNWPAIHARVRDALYRDATERGGVISGEHGIGLVKRPFLHASIGDGTLDVMRRIKGVLDPRGILNPGKILEPVPLE